MTLNILIWSTVFACIERNTMCVCVCVNNIWQKIHRFVSYFNILTGSDYSQVVQQHKPWSQPICGLQGFKYSNQKHCVSNLLKTFGMWNDALDSNKGSHTVKTSAQL